MVEQKGVSYADYMHNTLYGSPFEQSTPLVDKTREKCALGSRFGVSGTRGVPSKRREQLRAQNGSWTRVGACIVRTVMHLEQGLAIFYHLVKSCVVSSWIRSCRISIKGEHSFHVHQFFECSRNGKIPGQ